MTALTMFQVDAFTDRLFAGNPAAVLVLDTWLPDRLMADIAAENNLAETAFLVAHGPGAWHLRWFAPAGEVPFCGHATLAAAHVLASEFGVAGPMAFATAVGTLTVTGGADGYRLDLPAHPPLPLDGPPPAELVAMTGGRAVDWFRSFENLFARLADAEAVERFVPDLPAIARLHPFGFAVTAEDRGGGGTCVSRYFAPGAGIPEDAVTGSIHATLVPYWAAVFGEARLTARQASPRGGLIAARLAGDRVILAGHAVTYLKGQLRLGPTGI